MEENIILWLPWPPTVNSYYKAVRSAIYLSSKGRKYKETVEELVNEQAADIKLDMKLFVEVWLFPPDRRERDVDNYMKALLDAITHSGLWENDALIDQLHIYRGEVGSGKVRIEICEAGPLMKEDYKTETSG
jgi:crossover junction endodeoxyribonuclease RusA